jgi:predicted transcriptional regulator
MTGKRDRIGIMHDILQLIRDKDGKIKPTQIMYKANLSHSMLKEYMDELQERRFIVENVDRKQKRTYNLTEKGYNFLKDYEVIKSFFDSYGLG